MREDQEINRRNFIKATTFTAAGMLATSATPRVFAQVRRKDCSSKVNSLSDLAYQVTKNNQHISMEPGTYALNETALNEILAKAPLENDGENASFIGFSGSGNILRLTGVKILVDTDLHQFFNGTIDKFLITGRDNLIEGLQIEDQGDTPPTSGARMIHVKGENTKLLNMELFVRGSFPYGYGNLLGKGGSTLVPLRKQTSVLLRANDCKMEGCRIITRAFSHGIALVDADNTLIKDCYVEGAMRETDEILRETSGPAFENGFRSMYPPGYILPSKVISLSEDGIRTYGSSKNGTILNTTVKNMRSGYSVSNGFSLLDCVSIGHDEKGFNVGSLSTIKKCRGDAANGPLLSLRHPGRRDMEIELELIDTIGSKFPGTGTWPRIAEINGRNHHIKISSHRERIRPIPIPIVMGRSYHADINHWRDGGGDGYNERSGGNNITLINKSGMPIWIHDNISDSNVNTNGYVLADEGSDNYIKVI